MVPDAFMDIIAGLLKIMAGVWLGIACVGGIALMLGRYLAGVTVGILGEMRNSYGSLSLTSKRAEGMTAYKIRAFADDYEGQDHAMTKLTELSEKPTLSTIERECLREFLGRWLYNRLLRVDVKQRKDVLDALIGMLGEGGEPKRVGEP